MTSARDEILARIRAARHAAAPSAPAGTSAAAGRSTAPTGASAATAVAATADAAAAAAAADQASIPRDYLTAHVEAKPAELVDLLAEYLADYRAHVHRIGSAAEIAPLVHELIAGPRLVVPAGLPADWIPRGREIELLTDEPPLTAAELDTADAVLTGCALAIAETGTLVLDAGPGQGRRALTLVPDHHVCVVTAGLVVASLPEAIPRLRPDRPLTWIAGPSATSDIELDRVEGVHGPRRLDVLLFAPSIEP